MKGAFARQPFNSATFLPNLKDFLSEKQNNDLERTYHYENNLQSKLNFIVLYSIQFFQHVWVFARTIVRVTFCQMKLSCHVLALSCGIPCMQ